MTTNSFPVENNDGGPSSPDRLEAYAGLLGDVSRLITEVDANQRSPRSEHTFTFEHLSEFRAEVPQIVSELMPDLDQIDVTLIKTSPDDDMIDDGPSIVSISVDFISKTKMITMNRTAHGSPDDDTIIDCSYRLDGLGPEPLDGSKKQMQTESENDFIQRISHFEAISKAEFNKLIMSLVYPDEQRGYEMFADADLFSPRAFESLKDSFYFTALNNQSGRGYAFTTNDARISYFKFDGQPTSFTITYPEQYIGQPITAKNDMDTDFRLRFFTTELVENDPFTDGALPTQTNYFPTPSDIAYLRSIIETEVMAISPAAVGFADQASDELDPEVIFGDTGAKAIISKAHVAEVLEQLSFDPTDPGTT